MAAQFPSSPTVSQTYSYSGKTWIWSGSTWNLVSLSVMTVNTTAPATPSIGALWLSTETGDLAVYNGFSWIQSGGDTGATGPNLKITTISVCNSSYTILDDTAVSSTGGYIKLTGTGFAAGCIVTIGTVNATTTTYVSDAEVRAQLPATAAGSYTIYLTNTDGGTCFRLNAVTFSAPPVWTTGSYTSPVTVSTQLLATGDSTLTYTLTSGSLPSGITLSSSGLLSGTTTLNSYSFTVTATDAQLQDVSQVISLSVINAQVPVEYLVVAGGGGGGNMAGGGAGGVLQGSLSLSAAAGSSYTVTIGSGGAGGVGTSNTQGINGNISVFSSITTLGGGGGGAFSTTLSNGLATSSGTTGSGGGGGITATSPYPPGIIGYGTSPQGYNGGLGIDTGYGGGGGGGAGGTGGAGIYGASYTSAGGNGGVGIQSSISGTTTNYAGGGGGSAQGTGGTNSYGGGTGANVYQQAATQWPPGTINTGGGGGGGYTGNGGAGNSGIVIIRYADTYATATSTTGSPTITNPTGYRVYKWTSSGSITF